MCHFKQLRWEKQFCRGADASYWIIALGAISPTLIFSVIRVPWVTAFPFSTTATAQYYVSQTLYVQRKGSAIFKYLQNVDNHLLSHDFL